MCDHIYHLHCIDDIFHIAPPSHGPQSHNKPLKLFFFFNVSFNCLSLFVILCWWFMNYAASWKQRLSLPSGLWITWTFSTQKWHFVSDDWSDLFYSDSLSLYKTARINWIIGGEKRRKKGKKKKKERDQRHHEWPNAEL